MSQSIDTTDAPANIARLFPVAHELEPLLDYEAFVLRETPLGGSEADYLDIEGPLTKAISEGALECSWTDTADGRRRRYEWAEGARPALRAYLAELDRLPCGCRAHLPDSRADPAGVICCKFCGEAYDSERFKELVRGRL